MQEKLAMALCAAAGALCLALLGWLKSREPFNARKFTASAITAIIAGVSVGAVSQYDGAVGFMSAFLIGAGADATRHAAHKVAAKGLPEQ